MKARTKKLKHYDPITIQEVKTKPNESRFFRKKSLTRLDRNNPEEIKIINSMCVIL
jgi:hypothetical protein